MYFARYLQLHISFFSFLCLVSLKLVYDQNISNIAINLCGVYIFKSWISSVVAELTTRLSIWITLVQTLNINFQREPQFPPLIHLTLPFLTLFHANMTPLPPISHSRILYSKFNNPFSFLFSYKVIDPSNLLKTCAAHFW